MNATATTTPPTASQPRTVIPGPPGRLSALRVPRSGHPGRRTLVNLFRLYCPEFSSFFKLLCYFLRVFHLFHLSRSSDLESVHKENPLVVEEVSGAQEGLRIERRDGYQRTLDHRAFGSRGQIIEIFAVWNRSRSPARRSSSGSSGDPPGVLEVVGEGELGLARLCFERVREPLPGPSRSLIVIASAVL